MVRQGRRARRAAPAARQADYTHLRHPFAAQSVFSRDAIAAMHDQALRVLEQLGVRVLLKEARDIYAVAGARIDDDMVFIGRDIVAAAIETTPSSYTVNARNPKRSQVFEPGAMLFMAGAGCPHASDLERGRRPGSLQDFTETLQLQQHFDAIHMLGPSAEPQDIPPNLRHYDMMQAQMAVSDKPLFTYARGSGQVDDALKMIAIGHGLSDEQLFGQIWCTTIINTNSPRLIDRPMAQGLIDFARAGQFSIVTPFCLAGAMAPVTVAGALILQHAEALAAITLAQLAKPGAAVAYGGFTSNVDMKSGAPAMGTPEHMKMILGGGQLARHIGLPWRCATGTASTNADMQSAGETHMGLWACMLANATVTIHAAGWLESGLTFGYEKFINDMEAVQSLAEMCTPPDADAGAMAWEALEAVQPGGHFFGNDHTVARYDTAFYAPLVADLANFGTWEAAGGHSSAVRATAIWKSILAGFKPPAGSTEAAGRLEGFIARRKQAGGADPLD